MEWIGRSFQSGSLRVSLNGKPLGDIAVEKGSFKVDVSKNLFDNLPLDRFPSKMKELSLSHHLSRFLSSLGMRVDIDEDGEELASLGKGVHSVLGNVKLKVLRLKKLMR